MLKTLFLRFVPQIVLLTATSAFAQIPYEYVYPQAPFDVVAAEAQMSPGTSTVRGSISVHENKALIKALNISQRHKATKGTNVTLMPYTPHLEEWVALGKKLGRSRKALLKKASLSPDAASYRIVTKVIDDNGNYEFTSVKPGKYFVFAEVNFNDSGTYMEKTGSVDTYIGGAMVESIPSYTAGSYSVDLSKIASGIVEVVQEGQTVVATISGQ